MLESGEIRAESSSRVSGITRRTGKRGLSTAASELERGRGGWLGAHRTRGRGGVTHRCLRCPWGWGGRSPGSKAGPDSSSCTCRSLGLSCCARTRRPACCCRTRTRWRGDCTCTWRGRDKRARSARLVLGIGEASPPRVLGLGGCTEALGKGDTGSRTSESFQQVPPGIGVGFPLSLSPQRTLRNPNTHGSVHRGPKSSRKTMVLPNQGFPSRCPRHSHR